MVINKTHKTFGKCTVRSYTPCHQELFVIEFKKQDIKWFRNIFAIPNDLGFGHVQIMSQNIDRRYCQANIQCSFLEDGLKPSDVLELVTKDNPKIGDLRVEMVEKIFTTDILEQSLDRIMKVAKGVSDNYKALESTVNCKKKATADLIASF